MQAFKYAVIAALILDLISSPFKYISDRSPRPAWKKSYALLFLAVSTIIDVLIMVYVIMS